MTAQPNLLTIETQISRRLFADLIAAGYTVTVNDGEENVLIGSQDVEAIMKAARSTDEDVILVKGNGHKGWVKLIYGNEYDLISDYTMNLEPVIGSIYKWIEACPGYR